MERLDGKSKKNNNEEKMKRGKRGQRKGEREGETIPE